jgi:hypothetical protein
MLELLEQRRVLCKQGAGGSSPATSANHTHFYKIAAKPAHHNPLPFKQGAGGSSPLTSSIISPK